MRSRFNVRITLGVILALAIGIAVLHSLIYLSIQPEALSAAMPTTLGALK
jgi:hypothetical protein